MTPEEELQEQIRLSKQGEQETPPSPEVNNNQPTGTPPPPAPEPEQKRQNPGFWADSEIVRPTPPVAAGGATAVMPEPKIGAGKLDKKAIDMGARTAVSTINLAQVTLMRPILNWRFNKEAEKRYGVEQSERAKEMVMGDIKPTDEKERTLKARFQKFLDQRDKKLIDVPFSEEEESDLEYSFKTYFEMKQVAMSPEVLLYCSLGSILGKRAIDAFMWD